MGFWKTFKQKRAENKIAYLTLQLAPLAVTKQYEKYIQVANQICEIVKRAYGEKSPLLAVSFTNLGRGYYLSKNFSKAEEVYQRSLEIWPKNLDALRLLAILHRDTNDIPKAESFYQKAIEIVHAYRGGNVYDINKLKNSPGVSENDVMMSHLNNLSELASLYLEKKNYDRAEPLYQEALEISRKDMREMEADPQLYQDINFPAPDSQTKRVSLFQILNGLATVYSQMDDFRNALPLYEEAAEITGRVFGETHAEYAYALHNLATACTLLGDFTKAEPLHKKALEIKRTTVAEKDPSLVIFLNNLGRCYKEIGELSRALPLYEEALEITKMRVIENPLDHALTLNNIGMLYARIGDLSKAEPLFEDALQITRNVAGQTYLILLRLNNLAGLYVFKQEYPKAEALFEEALEVARKTVGEESAQYALVMHNLGGMYNEMNNFTEAKLKMDRALEIRSRVHGKESALYASTLSNLGLTYWYAGDYEKAESLQQEALEITRKAVGDKHPANLFSLYNLAHLYTSTNRHREAMNLLKETVTIQNLMIGQVFAIGSEQQRRNFIKALQTFLDTFLSVLLRHFSFSPEDIAEALDFVLVRKALGDEAIKAQRGAILSGKYPLLEDKLKELDVLRMQIAKKEMNGPGNEVIDAYNQTLEDWKQTKEKLESHLATQIPEIRLGRELNNANHVIVAENLPEGSVLLEFIRFNFANFEAGQTKHDLKWTPPRYLAFILLSNNSNNVEMIDLGEAELIDDMINKYRTWITSKNPETEQSELPQQSSRTNSNSSILDGEGEKLRSAIFDPLVARLPQGTSRLVIAPDGDICKLPFEVLPSSDRVHHLIDKFDINYLTTGRDVLRFNFFTSQGLKSNPLVAADPDYNLGIAKSEADLIADVEQAGLIRESELKNTLEPFDRLTGTREEGQEIAALLNVKPLLYEQVLENEIKACRSPSVLHIATHGFFLPDKSYGPNKDDIHLLQDGAADQNSNDMTSTLSSGHLVNPMLRSGLALAGANTWLQNGKLPEKADDGFLTAEDVTTMDLLNTELVVLSACETGLGDILTGEGVFGLRRAFVLAGAQTLVMSLWQVPDEQTTELMVKFYNLLLSGKSRSESLRKAQIEMKNKFPDPYYWGAFICQGIP